MHCDCISRNFEPCQNRKNPQVLNGQATQADTLLKLSLTLSSQVERNIALGSIMQMGKRSVTLARNVHKSQNHLMILLVSSVDTPTLKLSPWLPGDDCWLVNFKPR